MGLLTGEPGGRSWDEDECGLVGNVLEEAGSPQHKQWSTHAIFDTQLEARIAMLIQMNAVL